MRAPLPKEQVINAIEHRRPVRVPMMIHQWNNADAFGERSAEVRALQAEYPSDMFTVIPRIPQIWDDPSKPGAIKGYSWMHLPPPAGASETHAHDANVAIHDWSMLDEMLKFWPDPNLPEAFEGLKQKIAAEAAGRYVVFHWWYCLYERIWSLRGMENVMMDFYGEPESVHRFFDAITDFYCGWIRRAGRELGANAIYTTDDIGMQTGPMFSPQIFREFFLPRYKRMVEAAHEQNMHFWLHTCGDVRMFLDDLIEIGVDVIHPIQKYAMDEAEIAGRYGGRIAFWAGMDLQQILARGTPEQVRQEVRFLIDTFDSADGGCMITAGNGITGDTPVENLRAFYDETYNYGVCHRRKHFVSAAGTGRKVVAVSDSLTNTQEDNWLAAMGRQVPGIQVIANAFGGWTTRSYFKDKFRDIAFAAVPEDAELFVLLLGSNNLFEDGGGSDASVAEAADGVLKLAAHLKTLAPGAEFVLVAPPRVAMKNNQLAEPRPARRIDAQTPQFLKRLGEAYRSLARERGWRFVDLYPVLEEDDFVDAAHPGPAGNQKIATAIGSVVKDWSSGR